MLTTIARPQGRHNGAADNTGVAFTKITDYLEAHADLENPDYCRCLLTWRHNRHTLC
jgi:hypothetical protein